MPRLRLLLVLIPGAACATNPPQGSESERSAYVRLLEVEPSIGSRLSPEATIRVRATYRLPPDARGHTANLMFLTENGRLVSARGDRAVDLSAPEGVIELSADPAKVLRTLREPLTAIIMIMGPPGEIEGADTIPGLGPVPAEVAARLRQLRDSASRGDSLRVRTIVRRGPMASVARSRRIFFNGAGPAPGTAGSTLFTEVIEEYRSYRGAKAFALAIDEESGRRTWGYSFGFNDPDRAIARALRECRSRVERRRLTATCEVFVNADSIPVR